MSHYPNGRPVDLLIADDDPAVALMASVALTEHGFAVRIADSGEAALRAWEAAKPDIILLDVVMPGISGFDVCRQIRVQETDGNVPIIMATSLDDSASIERAYVEGATAFVTKPVNWPLLRHQLQYVLRTSRDRERLAESEERYALAAAGANDGLWDWHIAKQRVFFSPRWREQLKLRELDPGDQMDAWLARIHPDDQLSFRNELNAHLSGNVAKFEVEYRIRDAEQEYRWMLCRGLAIRDETGNAYRIAGSQTDITERKRAEDKLVHDALHDGLTRLANRKLLLERVSHAITLAKRRSDYQFAVAVIDLDRFKTINDSLGHLAGDSLLCRIADRIDAHLRASDTLARIGGDEFAILFDDTGDRFDLDRLIERIRREISIPFMLMKQEVVATASVGIAIATPKYDRAEDLLRDADIAMYRAKANGKNCHELFDPGMHAAVASMVQTESALRAAIPRRELCVYYQPIRQLDNGRIVGFEALLRWRHPTRGLLAPEAFLRLAEESGLIVPIGHWTMREATQQLANWNAKLPQTANAYISINLSSAEFAHPDLLTHVGQALSLSGLAPKQLKLEMTETVLVENTIQANKVLDQLREMGIATSIDDFGTGYSSFSYLLRFAFDTLKIDRTFIREIDQRNKNRAIVRSIVQLAGNLGLNVIAEGGENNAEVDCLREIGCQFNQGFAFSQALPADQIEALLAAQHPPSSRLAAGSSAG